MKKLLETFSLILLIALSSCKEAVSEDFIERAGLKTSERIMLDGIWSSKGEEHMICFFDSTFIYACDRYDHQILPTKGSYFLRKYDSILFVSTSNIAAGYKSKILEDEITLLVGEKPLVVFHKLKH